MIRGKIYSKNNKRVYRVLIIDYFNSKVDVIDGDSYATFEFKDVKFLESTGIKGDKGYIYRNDFLVAKKDEKTITGIVKYRNGAYFLANKKTETLFRLDELKLEDYKIKNLGNAMIYFAKLKSKKVEK